MKVLRYLSLAVGVIVTTALAPDCIAHRYGCTYVVWYRGDGTGDALVSCDEGATYHYYYGSVGGCPDGY